MVCSRWPAVVCVLLVVVHHESAVAMTHNIHHARPNLRKLLYQHALEVETETGVQGTTGTPGTTGTTGANSTPGSGTNTPGSDTSTTPGSDTSTTPGSDVNGVENSGENEANAEADVAKMANQAAEAAKEAAKAMAAKAKAAAKAQAKKAASKALESLTKGKAGAALDKVKKAAETISKVLAFLKQLPGMQSSDSKTAYYAGKTTRSFETYVNQSPGHCPFVIAPNVFVTQKFVCNLCTCVGAILMDSLGALSRPYRTETDQITHAMTIVCSLIPEINPHPAYVTDCANMIEYFGQQIECILEDGETNPMRLCQDLQVMDASGTKHPICSVGKPDKSKILDGDASKKMDKREYCRAGPPDGDKDKLWGLPADPFYSKADPMSLPRGRFDPGGMYRARMNFFHPAVLADPVHYPSNLIAKPLAPVMPFVRQFARDKLLWLLSKFGLGNSPPQSNPAELGLAGPTQQLSNEMRPPSDAQKNRIEENQQLLEVQKQLAEAKAQLAAASRQEHDLEQQALQEWEHEQEIFQKI